MSKHVDLERIKRDYRTLYIALKPLGEQHPDGKDILRLLSEDIPEMVDEIERLRRFDMMCWKYYPNPDDLFHPARLMEAVYNLQAENRELRRALNQK